MHKSVLHNLFRTLMLPLREIDNKAPKKGKIIDLGCGEGVIAKYLAQNQKREVVGVDIDKKRLGKSQQKNLSFKSSDIRRFDLKGADAVVISDVLHHLNYHDQRKVLMNVASSLKSGGILIIKEIDTDEFIRSKLSRLWDYIFYPSEKIYFNKAASLENKLKSLGFRVVLKRTTRFFPGSTTLFFCRK